MDKEDVATFEKCVTSVLEFDVRKVPNDTKKICLTWLSKRSIMLICFDHFWKQIKYFIKTK